jgi:hypothetical protein
MARGQSRGHVRPGHIQVSDTCSVRGAVPVRYRAKTIRSDSRMESIDWSTALGS